MFSWRIVWSLNSRFQKSTAIKFSQCYERVQIFVNCKYFDKLSITTVIAKRQTFLKLVKCIHFTIIYTLLYALAKYAGF